MKRVLPRAEEAEGAPRESVWGSPPTFCDAAAAVAAEL